MEVSDKLFRAIVDILKKENLDLEIVSSPDTSPDAKLKAPDGTYESFIL